MKPAFKSALAWDQANILLQPIMIRVIDNLRKQLEDSPWQGEYKEVQLPYPGYQLSLSRNDREFILDIWQICYQICFVDYPRAIDQTNPAIAGDYPVDIDATLIEDTGEVNWQQLETKTQRLVSEIFDALAHS